MLKSYRCKKPIYYIHVCISIMHLKSSQMYFSCSFWVQTETYKINICLCHQKEYLFSWKELLKKKGVFWYFSYWKASSLVRLNILARLSMIAEGYNIILLHNWSHFGPRGQQQHVPLYTKLRQLNFKSCTAIIAILVCE